MDSFLAFIVPALAGVGIGVLSGLLGVGGGVVMVPLFRLAFAMSPVVATATSLFSIIPTSLAGALSHIRHKTCIPSLGVAAGVGGAFTSPVGVWLAQASPGWMIMVAAALIICWSACSILAKAFKRGSSTKQSVADQQTAPSALVAAEDCPIKLTRTQLLIGVGIGLVTGLASGYVGLGGGFLMVPLMLSLVGVALHQVSGTSLIAVMILAIPGVVEQALLGNINYMTGIAIALGSIPGAIVGARLVRVVPERALRLIFGGFLLLSAILLVVNEFAILD